MVTDNNDDNDPSASSAVVVNHAAMPRTLSFSSWSHHRRRGVLVPSWASSWRSSPNGKLGVAPPLTLASNRNAAEVSGGIAAGVTTTTNTIDEALQSLYYSHNNNDKNGPSDPADYPHNGMLDGSAASSSSSYLPSSHHDWLLDGGGEWWCFGDENDDQSTTASAVQRSVDPLVELEDYLRDWEQQQQQFDDEPEPDDNDDWNAFPYVADDDFSSEPFEVVRESSPLVEEVDEDDFFGDFQCAVPATAADSRSTTTAATSAIHPPADEPLSSSSSLLLQDVSLTALSEVDSHYHDDDNHDDDGERKCSTTESAEEPSTIIQTSPTNDSATRAHLESCKTPNHSKLPAETSIDSDDDDDVVDLVWHADEMLRRCNLSYGDDNNNSNNAPAKEDQDDINISPASLDTPELLRRTSDSQLRPRTSDSQLRPRDEAGVTTNTQVSSSSAAAATSVTTSPTPREISIPRPSETVNSGGKNALSLRYGSVEEKKFDPLVDDQHATDLDEEEDVLPKQQSKNEVTPVTWHGRRFSASAITEKKLTTQHHPSEAIPPTLHRHSSAPGNLQLEEPDPLWARLPLEDLSTLEARFIRRCQQRYEADRQPLVDSVHDLGLSDSSHWWTSSSNPQLDDTIQLLQSLPWHHIIPATQRRTSPRKSSVSHKTADDDVEDDWDRAECLTLWDDHTTNRLCDLDEALERLQGAVLQRIQPHQSTTLARANQLLHEWETNLRLAFLYWERACGSLEQATSGGDESNRDGGGGLKGHRRLLELWQEREQCAAWNCLLADLDAVWAKEKDLLRRIDLFDIRNANALEEYYAVMAAAQELEATISDERLGKAHCLDEMRSRLASIGSRFWDRLLSLAQSLVSRSCRGPRNGSSCFDQTEYQRLVQAVLDFRHHASAASDEATCFSIESLPARWSENLLRALNYEAERTFAVALLEPTDVQDSEFQQELRVLSQEADLHWGDTAKLRSLSHNLVTIRFVFEPERYYFPKIFHRLCQLLTNVLHTHFLLHEWHRTSWNYDGEETQSCTSQHDAQLQTMFSDMNSSVLTFWDHCEEVIIRCFDEYLHFAPKISLFERSDNAMDDSLWKKDLQNLQDVLLLTDRFVSIRYSFLNVRPPAASNLSSLRDGSHEFLCEKLTNIFRRHLRSVHVEAMNSVGRRLANESWVLGMLLNENGQRRAPDRSLESVLFGLFDTSIQNLTSHETETRYNCYAEDPPDLSITRFAETGNPFDIRVTTTTSPRGDSLDQARTMPQLYPSGILSGSAMYEALSIFLPDAQCFELLSPDVVTRELVVWFSRLLLTIDRLPLIVPDASAVFANLCDLYITTVFRLCAGNGHSEHILLGTDEPKLLSIPPPIVPALNVPDDNVSGSPGFFSFRTKGLLQVSGRFGLSRPLTALPNNLEAEICSPLKRDSQQIFDLREYIFKAQESLQDVVSIDMVDNWLEESSQDSPAEQACEAARLLGKREGAIWGCLVVVALVDAASSVAANKLKAAFSMTEMELQFAPLKAYCKKVLAVIPTLAQVSRMIACTRAVGGAHVVGEIIKVGPGWEENKLHEHCNDYVEDLCDRCALIWGFLTVSAKLPAAALKIVWEHMVSTAYLSLLDGFSRVPSCSTEGRALMALDLASFASGVSPGNVMERLEQAIELASRPPIMEPLFNMRYVDTYVKVFYYPRDDVISWVAENYSNYKLNHVLALVIAATAETQQCQPRIGNSTLTEVVDQVKRIYCGEHSAEPH